jgi:hypothetical protein
MRADEPHGAVPGAQVGNDRAAVAMPRQIDERDILDLH